MEGDFRGKVSVISTQDYSSVYDQVDLNTERVTSVSINADGRHVLVSGNTQLHYYAFNNGKLITVGEPRSLAVNSIWSAAMSLDGRYTVAGGDTQVVSVFSISDQGLSKRGSNLSGHTETILQLKFTPSGHLISAGADASIRFWEVEHSRQLFNFKLPSSPRPQLFNYANPLESFDYQCMDNG